MLWVEITCMRNVAIFRGSVNCVMDLPSSRNAEQAVSGDPGDKYHGSVFIYAEIAIPRHSV